MMTKCLSFDIARASSWFSFINLSENSKDQLEFWKGTLNRLNLKKVFDQESCTKSFTVMLAHMDLQVMRFLP